MFANLPLPFSLVALQGLEAPLTSEQVRDAAWGADQPFESLAPESLADALPARFDTLSFMQKDDEALIVCEAMSQTLTAWRGENTSENTGGNTGGNTGEADDPFEALDEALPAQHLTVVHFDPAQNELGLLFADDGVLKRRIFINTLQPERGVSTGIIDTHEQRLWEASDLDGLERAEDLPRLLVDIQEDGPDHLQIVLTSLLVNRLRFGFCLDLLNPSGAIWAESVASFCLDEVDS